MSQNLYLRIRSAIFKTPWAILPSRLDIILAYLEARANGIEANVVDEAVKQAEKQAAQTREALREQGVAVIPINGTITYRAAGMGALSGRTASSREVVEKTREALGDSRVGAVLHHYNSPGGTVSGLPEAAAEIRSMRGEKPIVAIADTMMASAAYHIGSSADEVVVTPSGEVGSIGVFAVHEDFSQQYERLGEHYTLVASAKYKGEGLDFLPMDEDYRGHLEDQVLAFDDIFVKDVAKNRGVTEKKVRQDFGQGRMVMAKDAVKVGLADRVETFDQVVNRLIAGCGRKRRRRAEARSVIAAMPYDPGEGLEEELGSSEDTPQVDNLDENSSGPESLDEARLAVIALEEAVESGNSDLIDVAFANAEEKVDALCITEREAEDFDAKLDAARAALAGLIADSSAEDTDVPDGTEAVQDQIDSELAANRIAMLRRQHQIRSF